MVETVEMVGRAEGAARPRRRRTGAAAAGLLAASAAALPVGAAAAAAADGAPAAHLGVEVAAQPAAVAIGDQLTITVTYRWPHGWTVETPNREPDPADAFAREFVTGFPPAQSTSSGEEERRTFRLTVLANHSGSWSCRARPSACAALADGATSPPLR